MRILVVEDDPLLGDGIQAGLAQAGFGVDWVKDGVAGELALKTASHAAVVLDLGLPRLAGLDLLRRMRSGGNKTPVLILTGARRDRGPDQGTRWRCRRLCGQAFRPARACGAPARVDPPFGRRRPRRCFAWVRSSSIPPARRVAFKGRPVELPAREYALLHALMLGAGRVLTREQLTERLYAWGEEVESNAIDVHIHHLRRKLSPLVIRTVRGVGYLMPRQANG
jgi:two-component system OmpR family response regulator/two-component system response regulator QseB